MMTANEGEPKPAGFDGLVEEPALVRRRLAWQYPFDDAAAWGRAAEEIDGLTHAEWEAWIAAGAVDCRDIDGARRFARSFVGNLLRREPATAARARHGRPRVPTDPTWGAADAPNDCFDLDAHLRDLLVAADAGAPPLTLARRNRVTFTITVARDALPVGETIRCWMPYPIDAPPHRDIQLVAAAPAPLHIAAPDAPHRTLYFEAPQTADGARFSATYEFLTLPVAPPPDPSDRRVDASFDPRRDPALAPFLAERPPHVVFTPELRAVAASLADGAPHALAIARRAFEWIATNTRYIAEIEYGLLPSLATKGLATREGDCGVLAMMFIALCRAAGVPARWRSGWFLKPRGGTMHDWAEFFVAPLGWLPADPTYGLRAADPREATHAIAGDGGDAGIAGDGGNAGNVGDAAADTRNAAENAADPDHRWFYCGGMDALRLVTNTNWGAPLDPPRAHPRAEPVDLQRGELEWRAGPLFFDQWTHDVTWSPASESFGIW